MTLIWLSYDFDITWVRINAKKAGRSARFFILAFPKRSFEVPGKETKHSFLYYLLASGGAEKKFFFIDLYI